MVIFFCCRGGQSVLFSSHYFFLLEFILEASHHFNSLSRFDNYEESFQFGFFSFKKSIAWICFFFFSCMNKMTDLYFISFENFCVISWPKMRAGTIFLVLRDIMIGDDDGKFVLCSFFSSKFYKKKILLKKNLINNLKCVPTIVSCGWFCMQYRRFHLRFICCSMIPDVDKQMNSIYLLRHLLHRFFQYFSLGIVYACRHLAAASFHLYKMGMNPSLIGPFHVLVEVFL